VLVGHLVQIKERLVHGFLKLHGRLHGVEPAAPLILGRSLDVLQDDAAATVVLKLHELLGVLQFFFGRFPEVLGKAIQGDIVAFEVVRLMEKVKYKY